MLSSLCIQTLNSPLLLRVRAHSVRTLDKKEGSAALVKLCTACETEKPYNPDAKPYSKASGFIGAVCYECALRHNREKYNAGSRSRAPVRKPSKASRLHFAQGARNKRVP